MATKLESEHQKAAVESSSVYTMLTNSSKVQGRRKMLPVPIPYPQVCVVDMTDYISKILAAKESEKFDVWHECAVAQKGSRGGRVEATSRIHSSRFFSQQFCQAPLCSHYSDHSKGFLGTPF